MMRSSGKWEKETRKCAKGMDGWMEGNAYGQDRLAVGAETSSHGL
jgi:hypothetical protein